jgi:SM-20-related protein
LDAIAACPEAGLPSFDTLSLQLEARGYVVIPGGLPQIVANELLRYIQNVDASDFHRAGIGRGADERTNSFVRRDSIHWLHEGRPELAEWRSFTDALRTQLNRNLFLGLFSFESHLARYSPGDFYKKHYDAFRGEANRIVSMVCYLNTDWAPGDGGELRLYTDAMTVTVLPDYRKLVLFLSEETLHEVLPTNRERWSVTGWFRLNQSRLDRVDPPR